MKKRSFSLVEVLIATLLGVMLITSLMQIYRLSQQSDQKGAQIEKRLFEKSYARDVLSETLALGVERSDFSLLEQSGLIFSFDNGIDPDPKLCGLVLGRLWHGDGGLIFSIYGIKKEKVVAMREERLISSEKPPHFKMWDGEEWEEGKCLHVKNETRVVQIEVNNNLFTTHMIYAPPLEV